jgi:hypothetical protein
VHDPRGYNSVAQAARSDALALEILSRCWETVSSRPDSCFLSLHNRPFSSKPEARTALSDDYIRDSTHAWLDGTIGKGTRYPPASLVLRSPALVSCRISATASPAMAAAGDGR